MAPVGVVIVWLTAPASLQLAKTYRVPPPPCEEVVAMVCALPVVQLKVCGAVYATPSTVKLRPAGLVATVTPPSTVKVAVTLRAADAESVCGLVAPARSPLQPLNW